VDEERPTDAPDDWKAVTSLGEPTRRVIYDYVVSVGDWVGRDQAAEATGLERGTAVHHLDRLAADGLLDVGFQRLTGRQGPGAGRPAKLYRRSHREFDVSLPPRDYELAGRMLAEAVDRARADGTAITDAVADVAREEGRRVGQSIRSRLRDSAGKRARRAAVLTALEDLGYEPKSGEGGSVVLKNCPFHQLAQTHTDLVCGMNLCLLGAAVESAAATDLEVGLVPSEGLCCVRLRPAETGRVSGPGRT
jgi:predicted ArsR family transcriptional regulator